MQVTKNKYGIKVSMCCASCHFKESTRLMTTRYCTKLNKDVSPLDVCEHWRMSKLLKQVGSAQGPVKRGEYLMYLIYVRVKEQEMLDKGDKVVPKNIAEIRNEYEKEHGSIYLNL